MMALADTIELAKRREQAAIWDKNETDILAKVELPPPPELDDETRRDLQNFLQWTTTKQVRHCPARPGIVAAYVFDIAATGASTEQILQRVNAISALHSRYSLADPVSTFTARAALETVIHTVDPPRSWPKSDQQAFVQLPIEVKAIIAKREQDRERTLRRAQNELATMKRQNQTAPDAKPVIETQKEEVHG